MFAPAFFCCHADEQRATHDENTFHRDASGKPETDEALLRRMVEDHHRWTGSLRAREILEHWGPARGRFVKVFPSEYRRALIERQADQTLVTGDTPIALEANATIERARQPAREGSRKVVPAK